METLKYPKGRQAIQWFDVRRRKSGMWAYTLNRLTGIGLVVYLYLHLGILSLLTRGPGSWDAFIAVARSPFVLTFDVVLIAGALIHGLNGIRIALTGLDKGVKTQKVFFGVLMLVVLIALAIAIPKIYGG
jgi:succinate dehydrogenase / fumarate reductase cytochrome b subunit